MLEAQSDELQAGEEYLLLDRSVSRVTDHIGRSSNANLLLDWPVNSIEYSKQGATVRGSGGRQIRCGKVIITVPILALQQGDILFKPALPPAKCSAIDRIKMSNAVKVIPYEEAILSQVCSPFIIDQWFKNTRRAKQRGE